MDSLSSQGMSDGEKIYIFNKNYNKNGWIYFSKELLKEKNLIQEIIVSDITYHEIKLVLSLMKPK